MSADEIRETQQVPIMKKLNVIGVYVLVVLMLGVMGLMVPKMAAAMEKGTEQKADQKALKEGLGETLGTIFSPFAWCRFSRFL